MVHNFRGDIAVNFDYFQMSVLSCESVDLLVCHLAFRVPAGAEVHHNMSELVFAEVGVKRFKF